MTVKSAHGLRWHRKRLFKEIVKNKYMYLLLLPGILYFLVFSYAPMYGIQLAWKKFMASDGIAGSEWIGWTNFIYLFKERDFWNALRNTLIIAGMQIAIVFPFPIALAILFNEVKQARTKKILQIVMTFPHFLSWVILASIVYNLFGDSGVFNNILNALGLEKCLPLMDKGLFRWMLIGTLLWKESGWSAILYMATITSIDPALYEAAKIDGANRWQRIVHVTLPGISTIVTAMFILRIGGIMNAGYMQVLTLYNAAVYEVGDILDTYVYRITFQKMPDYGVSTSVSLFKGIVNAILMMMAEFVSRKTTGEGLF